MLAAGRSKRVSVPAAATAVLARAGILGGKRSAGVGTPTSSWSGKLAKLGTITPPVASRAVLNVEDLLGIHVALPLLLMLPFNELLDPKRRCNRRRDILSLALELAGRSLLTVLLSLGTSTAPVMIMRLLRAIVGHHPATAVRRRSRSHIKIEQLEPPGLRLVVELVVGDVGDEVVRLPLVHDGAGAVAGDVALVL